MPNWRCPKCSTENRAEGKFCEQCGQRRSDQTDVSSGLRGQGRSILDEVKKEAAGSFKGGGTSLDHISVNLPDFPDLGAKLPDIGFKMPDAGLKLPDLGLKMPDLGGMMPDLDLMKDKRQAVEKVTTRDLKLKLQVVPRLNYASAHCGLPIVPELEIHNDSDEPAQDVLIKAWLATDYGEPWQKTVPSIPAKQSCVEKDIVIPLQKSRLQEMREAERANLRVDVYTEGAVQVSETVPVEVLAYNEWYYHPDRAALMACFVQPNSAAIEKVISCVRDRLRLEYRDTSLDGYQSDDPQKIVLMLEALYYTLQKDLQLTYINPPPSFEKPEILGDGKFTMSQKVFFPESILEHRRGTCLDLALFCAACVERMGLNPLCFLVRGHAFYGVWLKETALEDPIVKDISIVEKLVEGDKWLPLNSTTFASSSSKRFSDCREEGLYCLKRMQLTCVVDVFSARYHGYKPIPPLVAGV